MFAHERQQKILRLLDVHRTISLAKLGRELQVSPATLRRDLDFLASLGRLTRTHGGAVHPESSDGEVPFDRKERAAVAAKAVIAEASAALIGHSRTCFVDAGTTALALGRLLLQKKGLTVVTNSVPLLNERSVASGTRVIAVGGEVRSVSLALVGAGAAAWMRQLHFDIAFVAASGLDSEGPSTTELSEAELKREMLSQADRCVLIADGTKWERRAAIRFAEWTDIDDFVTDRLTPEARRAVQARGVSVRLAATA
ncbi:DeoR/GlpR family DNA-binding transcription regulator [Nibricoccus sp. IMCC34717]|uniref:DeoR/GlpR family DNA-binding transcription regulator n=1 Tax=Nibricoccus sp. IMCC34717 TaxID=3034021 RepID=UPI00384A4C02